VATIGIESMGTRRGTSGPLPRLSGVGIYGCCMASDDLHPPVQDGDQSDPLDPNELPLAQLGRPPDDAADGPGETEHRQVRIWWFVGVTAAVVVIGLVIGIFVFNRSAPGRAHGALTAQEAAVQFVTAVNDGSERRAAAISCDTFVDDAKAVARSGQDNAFSLRLARVRLEGSGSATAFITQRLSLAGKVQRAPANVTVLREAGLWLMCGRIG
jgi:hypothetical protein